MGQQVLLVEIQVISPAGVASVLRFSDRAIRPMPPTDGLRPNIGFDSRLREAPAIRRLLFDDLSTLKPSVGVGTLTLVNADHALDAFEGHAWGEIEVRDWDEGTPSAEAVLILRGLCQAPAYGRSGDQAVRVALADYSAEMSKALQTTFYAGTNGVGPVLYEGAEDGLKGTPKPLAWGDLRTAHIPPPQVNGGEQAWQFNDGPVQGAEALFDRGDAFGLTDDGDLAGAAFDAAAPAAAHYVTDLARGLVKFNSAPVGQFTVGFKGSSADGYVETAGPILARILAKGGVAPARISASVAGLPAPAVVGFYAGEPTTLGEAVRLVAAGAPAAVLPDRAGVWRALPYGPPATTPDVTIGGTDIIDCATDDVAPSPVGEIRVGYGRIWKTFTGAELAPALADTDDKARLASTWRWAVATDAAVKARFPSTWRTVEIQTALREPADAEALAATLKQLLGLKTDGRPRRLWRVTLLRQIAQAYDLGASVAMTYPRMGLSGTFLLVGEEPLRPRRNQTIWTLWG